MVVSARVDAVAKYTCFDTALTAEVEGLAGNRNETTTLMQASDGAHFDFISLQQGGVLQSPFIAATFAICDVPENAVPTGKKIMPMAIQTCKTVLMAQLRNMYET